MNQIRATECIAREVIQGQQEEVQGLINPVNDGNLAAWMMALDRAKRTVGTLQTVCDAISARPYVGTGHPLRAVASEQFTEVDFATLNVEEEAAFDQIEAQAMEDATKAQEAEAERINAARPEVFNINEALAMVRPPHLAKEA